jgi:hypothetical protein
VTEVTADSMLVRFTVSAKSPDDLAALRESTLEALLEEVRPADAPTSARTPVAKSGAA